MEQEHKQKRKEFYEKNKEKLLGYQKNRYNELLNVFQKWKGTLECSRCGESDHACLDFHHSNPAEKEVGVIRQITKSISSVLRELRKCVIVCANCHRRIHAYNIPTDPTIDDLATRFENFVKQDAEIAQGQSLKQSVNIQVTRTWLGT